MCRDALARDESCGAHFREEHQTDEGEAQTRRRAIQPFGRLGAREGARTTPRMEKEPLAFEYVHPTQRSYK